MTTAEIAYMLAYDDTNSFYRAFRTLDRHNPRHDPDRQRRSRCSRREAVDGAAIAE